MFKIIFKLLLAIVSGFAIFLTQALAQEKPEIFVQIGACRPCQACPFWTVP